MTQEVGGLTGFMQLYPEGEDVSVPAQVEREAKLYRESTLIGLSPPTEYRLWQSEGEVRILVFKRFDGRQMRLVDHCKYESLPVCKQAEAASEVVSWDNPANIDIRGQIEEAKRLIEKNKGYLDVPRYADPTSVLTTEPGSIIVVKHPPREIDRERAKKIAQAIKAFAPQCLVIVTPEAFDVRKIDTDHAKEIRDRLTAEIEKREGEAQC